ncbi:MAG: hypothetical protein MK135_09075 [Polyangiaceae bacterium]|nr:hypothetical protein [Polyangiaceae bacterium]
MADDKNSSKTGEKAQASSGPQAQPMPNGDTIVLPAAAAGAGKIALIVGVVSLAIAYFTAGGWQQFSHSYLTAFMWGLSISVGGVWWVMLQHLLGARASVVMRRVGEVIAQGVLLMSVLALVIIVPTVFLHDSTIYQWVNHDYMESSHALHSKVGYLNTTFFFIRMVFYFAFWSLMARWWLKKSMAQDSTKGDVEYTLSLQGKAAPALIGFTIAVTFCAVDFLMSLDAYWFSTIFGIYYFATCVITFHSFLALAIMWLQKKGVLAKSVNAEHFHDIGKMMFAFTCFWSYVGFSQFMLIWYANIPEESHWYHERFEGSWMTASLVLAFFHFIVPFFGMMSRYMKRNPKTLKFWAFYLLAICWFDMYWLVAPNIHHGGVNFQLSDLFAWVGMAGLVVWFFVLKAQKKNLVATGDPRLKRSLAFENI